jgi:thioredoxin reductase (NADPH)
VLAAHAIGGQAGTGSMIRNYLGFRGASTAVSWPTGHGSKWCFPGRVRVHASSGRLSCRGIERVITLADGSRTTARAVLIPAGVACRRLQIPALDRLVGAGVFYGAAGVEAPAMAGEGVLLSAELAQRARPPCIGPGTRRACTCSCMASPWPSACLNT